MTGSDSTAWEIPESLQMLISDGEAEMVEEFFGLFRADTSSRLEKIDQALRLGEISQIRAQAHTIKGSAIQMGAGALAEDCRRIETGVHSMTERELADAVARLHTAFEHVCRLMAGYCLQSVRPVEMK